MCPKQMSSILQIPQPDISVQRMPNDDLSSSWLAHYSTEYGASSQCDDGVLLDPGLLSSGCDGGAQHASHLSSCGTTINYIWSLTPTLMNIFSCNFWCHHTHQATVWQILGSPFRSQFRAGHCMLVQSPDRLGVILAL